MTRWLRIPFPVVLLAVVAACGPHPPGPSPSPVPGPQGPAGVDGRDGADGRDGRDGVRLPEPTVTGVSIDHLRTGDTWHFEAHPEGTGVGRLGSGAFAWRAVDGHGRTVSAHSGSTTFSATGRTATLVNRAPSALSRTVTVTVRVQQASDSVRVGP